MIQKIKVHKIFKKEKTKIKVIASLIQVNRNIMMMIKFLIIIVEVN